MKVLITDPLAAAGPRLLEAAGLEVEQIPFSESDRWMKILPEVSAWIVRSGSRVTDEYMALAPRLKVIGRAGVGVDNIDVAAATRRGILVMNAPDGNTIAAAEHTLALIFGLIRKVHQGHAQVIRGSWDRHRLKGEELAGKTLGIIGLGRIGRAVAQRALGLEMRLLGFDPYLDPRGFPLRQVAFTGLEELLQRADIVTLHTPLTPETRHLIGAAELRLMKSTAYLINCARGGLVDETACAEALQEERLAGYAADSFEQEPPPADYPLLKVTNVLFTPHLGASTREAGERVARQICVQIRDYLLEEQPLNAVNLPITASSDMRLLRPQAHLAGILGRIMHLLLPGPCQELKLYAQVAQGDLDYLMASALQGFLAPRREIPVNLVNASALAAEYGLCTLALKPGNSSPELRLEGQAADGKYRRLSGVVGENGEFHLKMVDDYAVEMKLAGTLIFLENEDKPGVIGAVGTVLGQAGVNIAAYTLSRNRAQNVALGVIRCDERPSAEVIKRLAEIPEVFETVVVPLD